MSLKQRLRVAIGRRRPMEASLTQDDVGFTLRIDNAGGLNSAHHLEWREIRRVRAIRTESGSRQLLLETPDRSLLVTDAADTWESFVESLPARLTGDVDAAAAWEAMGSDGTASGETVIFESDNAARV